MRNLSIALIVLFAIITLIDVLTACEAVTSDAQKTDAHGNIILVIEGCEYIEVDRGAGTTRIYSLTHKGNCSNPIHRCR